MSAFIALLFGYLCGSIPFGLLLTRGAGTIDLRSIGSGNIGATNVLRTGRKDLAALTVLFDALKATFAIAVVRRFEADVALPVYAAAAGAFLGHLFPVWLRFRGGKGVATFLGCLIGLSWVGALVFVGVWLAVAATLRFSSAAALAASGVTPFVLTALGRRELAVLFALLAAALWVRHRANILRLANGTEARIGRKA